MTASAPRAAVLSGTTNGSGSLTAMIYGAPTTTFGPRSPDGSGSAGEWDYTDGYDFTPNTDWLVTAVRSCYGIAVSIWQDDGTLVIRQPVGDRSASHVGRSDPRNPARQRRSLRPLLSSAEVE
jgi:hypothetical protein